MLKVIHNGKEYSVDSSTASLKSSVIRRCTSKELYMDDGFNEDVFSIFIQFVNGYTIQLSREYLDVLELIAVKYDCPSLHELITEKLSEQNCPEISNRIIDSLFNFACQINGDYKELLEMQKENEFKFRKSQELITKITSSRIEDAVKDIINNSDTINLPPECIIALQKYSEVKHPQNLLERIPKDANVPVVNISFYGAQNVGKTSIWRLLDISVMDSILEPTVSDEVRIYCNVHGNSLCFIMEDTGGDESFIDAYSVQMQSLHGIIFVASPDIPESLEFISRLSKAQNESIPTMLFCNCLDQNHKPTDEIRKFAEEHGYEYAEGSPNLDSIPIIEQFMVECACKALKI